TNATEGEARAAGTTPGPLTKMVSEIDSGTELVEVIDVAFTRRFVIVMVWKPAGNCTPAKVTVEPLRVPWKSTPFTLASASVAPVAESSTLLVRPRAGE